MEAMQETHLYGKESPFDEQLQEVWDESSRLSLKKKDDIKQGSSSRKENKEKEAKKPDATASSTTEAVWESNVNASDEQVVNSGVEKSKLKEFKSPSLHAQLLHK